MSEMQRPRRSRWNVVERPVRDRKRIHHAMNADAMNEIDPDVANVIINLLMIGL